MLNNDEKKSEQRTVPYMGSVAVVGVGNRGGRVYGNYILGHPDEIRAVAVAEPRKERRDRFAREHDIEEKYQFSTWEDLLAEEKLADAIIIATLDTMHLEPALKAMEKGYKILLEKPISTNWEDTRRLFLTAREKGSEILIAHVLRYTPFYQKLKELLSSEIIGKIRLVDHIENIGYYHFAHSYVRGNWRNTQIAAPIILAKSCHDMDILYWLLEKKCLEINSHASLEYFAEKNHPQEAAERCLDCILIDSCPYSAKKIYLTENEDWPVSVITDDLSYQGRVRALREGPYGRCVYKCDNNVPDVQTIRMTMEDNLEINFALTAFSKEITRKTIFFGSLGEIRADFEAGSIIIDRFAGGVEQIEINPGESGHGGGDDGLISHFLSFIKRENRNEKEWGSSTTLASSVESHLMAFAAEESRKEERVVKMDEWRYKLICSN